MANIPTVPLRREYRCLWDYCPEAFGTMDEQNNHWITVHFPRARCIDVKDVDRYRRVQAGLDDDANFEFLTPTSQPMRPRTSRKRAHSELEDSQDSRTSGPQVAVRRSPRLSSSNEHAAAGGGNAPSSSRVDVSQSSNPTPPTCAQPIPRYFHDSQSSNPPLPSSPCAPPPAKRARHAKNFGALDALSSPDRPIVQPSPSPPLDSLIANNTVGERTRSRLPSPTPADDSSTSSQDVELELTQSVSISPAKPQRAPTPPAPAPVPAPAPHEPSSPALPPSDHVNHFRSGSMTVRAPRSRPPSSPTTTKDANKPAPAPSPSFVAGALRLTQRFRPAWPKPVVPITWDTVLSQSQSQTDEGRSFDPADGLLTQAQRLEDSQE